jgi:diacylglycerol kinase (ATP)
VRVTLFYSEGAGDSVSPDEIRETMERHGHDVVGTFERTSHEADVLDAHPDLVVAAGGDGTVAAAARMLAGRGIPLAFLPLGTANNIALSLGVDDSEEVIAAWADGVRRPFDMGIARGPWGERQFVEGVGCGLIPASIAAFEARPLADDSSSGEKLVAALRRYREVLENLRPQPWTIRMGEDATLEGDFLVVEVLNTCAVGPNVVLCQNASPSDGFLTIVTAREEHRAELVRYLDARIVGEPTLLALPSDRALWVDLTGAGLVHVDDKVLKLPSSDSVSIHLDVAALEFLTAR